MGLSCMDKKNRNLTNHLIKGKSRKEVKGEEVNRKTYRLKTNLKDGFLFFVILSYSKKYNKHKY